MDLTEIVKALVALATAVVSAVLVPWLKAKTSCEHLEDMLRWVELAVAAAEQLYDSGAGSAKKQYVMNFLGERGYRLDDEDVDIAIEAAVLRLHREMTA